MTPTDLDRLPHSGVLHRSRLAIVFASILTSVSPIVSPAHAQAPGYGSVHGQVLDSARHGIEGAEVALSPTGRRVVTTGDGAFRFDNVAPGEYEIDARRIGYHPTVRMIRTPESFATILITLASIPRELDSVVVRAKASSLRFSGVVVDQNGLPVSYAEVVAIGVKSGIIADSTGRFVIGGLQRGTLMIRVRKMGYSAYLGSLRLLAERTDTIVMPRLAEALTPVEIKERSGYGHDYWAFRDLDQRTRWKGFGAGEISREELDEEGKVNLCDALPMTATGVHLGLKNDRYCKTVRKRVLIDGSLCEQRMLTDFDADEVELVEFFGRDVSGNLAARGCPPPVYVIWLRDSSQH